MRWWRWWKRAARGGIKTGDVILAVDGKPVQTPSDLAREIAAAKPGSVVTLDVWRKHRHLPIKVTIGRQEAVSPQAGNAPRQSGKPDAAGLVLSQLTPEQRKQLDLSSGLLVRGTTGAARRAGLQAGDVILSLNNEAVDNVVNFESRLAQNKGKTVALLVARGGQTLFIPLKLDSASSGTGG